MTMYESWLSGCDLDGTSTNISRLWADCTEISYSERSSFYNHSDLYNATLTEMRNKTRPRIDYELLFH